MKKTLATSGTRQVNAEIKRIERRGRYAYVENADRNLVRVIRARKSRTQGAALEFKALQSGRWITPAQDAIHEG